MGLLTNWTRLPCVMCHDEDLMIPEWFLKIAVDLELTPGGEVFCAC